MRRDPLVQLPDVLSAEQPHSRRALRDGSRRRRHEDAGGRARPRERRLSPRARRPEQRGCRRRAGRGPGAARGRRRGDRARRHRRRAAGRSGAGGRRNGHRGRGAQRPLRRARTRGSSSTTWSPRGRRRPAPGPGVAAIAGTGSNVFGVGSAGAGTRTWRAGGWGHLLGDEGSGYWLGVESIKAALRDREASGPATALSEAAPAFFGAAERRGGRGERVLASP